MHTEQTVTYFDYFIKRDHLTILSGAFIFTLYHRVVKRREKLRLIDKGCRRSGGGGGGGQAPKSLTSGPSMGLISSAPRYLKSAHDMVAAVSSEAGESRYCIHYKSRYKSRRALDDVDLIIIAPLMTLQPFRSRCHVPFEIRLIGRAG